MLFSFCLEEEGKVVANIASDVEKLSCHKTNNVALEL